MYRHENGSLLSTAYTTVALRVIRYRYTLGGSTSKDVRRKFHVSTLEAHAYAYSFDICSVKNRYFASAIRNIYTQINAIRRARSFGLNKNWEFWRWHLHWAALSYDPNKITSLFIMIFVMCASFRFHKNLKGRCKDANVDQVYKWYIF